jgi:hypothetical protein
MAGACELMFLVFFINVTPTVNGVDIVICVYQADPGIDDTRFFQCALALLPVMCVTGRRWCS